MNQNIFIVSLLIVIIICVILVVLAYILGKKNQTKKINQEIGNTKEVCKKLLEDAKKEIDLEQKRKIDEGMKEVLLYKENIENELKDRKILINDLEAKLQSREESLDRRRDAIEKKEDILDSKETRLEEKKIELEKEFDRCQKLITEQEKKLEEVAKLKASEARNIILEETKEKMRVEIANYIKDEEEKAKDIAHNKAKSIISLAIQKYSSETSSEKTVSTVSLPVDELKGRIIGREGRNIRTFESLTGVDVIIDDTPEAVVLSSFDPIRREVAKKSLEILVEDGRIHPARIEEVVERCRSEVEMDMRERGEDAVFKTGIGKVHPDLVRALGRLYYRTSYGQNVLRHSIETAMIAGKLAAEIGENEILARRAGLFHDIGKALDHEVEGSHVDIGIEVCQKYGEPKEVIDAIASHHETVAPKSIIAVLVAAADALSSSRPGARSDSIENYAKRLEDLEEISNSIHGVSSSYAIQAGREIRVIVNPQMVDDLQTMSIAREIKEKIEEKLSYPGSIKVTVIRETRAVDTAK